MRIGIIGVQADGLLEPLHAQVASIELHERLPRQKEVARIVRIALDRFRGEIERALSVSELDQELCEIRVDDVVCGMVLVNEGKSLEIMLLRLADVTERLGRETQVVPRLVRERIEDGRFAKRLGR